MKLKNANMPWRFIDKASWIGRIGFTLLCIGLFSLRANTVSQQEIIEAASNVNLEGNPRHQAIVLKHIKEIHLLRCAEMITDSQYQNVMVWHQIENKVNATKALPKLNNYRLTMQKIAPDAGAYRKGSDTDFLVSRKDGKPLRLEDIRIIESEYRKVTNHAIRMLSNGTVPPLDHRYDTSTDFMVNHDATDPSEFARIAEYFQQKDADTYSRIEAARVEAFMRTPGQKISLNDASAYLDEMVEQAERKQQKIANLLKRKESEERAQRKLTWAEIHQLKYERNKYLGRINDLNMRISQQHPGATYAAAVYVPKWDLESFDIKALKQQSSTGFIHSLAGALRGDHVDTPEARQVITSLAQQLARLPMAERDAHWRNLDVSDAARQALTREMGNLGEVDSFRARFDGTLLRPDQLKKLQQFLKKTKLGQTLAKAYQADLHLIGKTLSGRCTLFDGVYDKGVARMQSLALWLNVLEQIEEAETDEDLAWSIGNTLVFKNPYMSQFGSALRIYSGAKSGDPEEMMKGLVLLLCPKAALPQLAVGIGDSVIRLSTASLFDNQFMFLYGCSVFENGELKHLIVDGSSTSLAGFFDDALTPGGYLLVDSALKTAMEWASTYDVGEETVSGLQMFSQQAFVKALESTIYGEMASFLPQDAGIQRAREALATVNERIDELATMAGRQVPRKVGPSWIKEQSTFAVGEQRALEKLIGERVLVWDRIKKALVSAVQSMLESRHRAELALGEGEDAMSDHHNKLRAILEELNAVDVGMEELERLGTYNFVKRTLLVSDKDKRIKYMEALQRMQAAYSNVLIVRDTFEKLLISSGVDTSELPYRPFTGSLPLTGNPELDQSTASDSLAQLVDTLAQHERGWTAVKRVHTNDAEALLDEPFDLEMIAKITKIHAEISVNQSIMSGARLGSDAAGIWKRSAWQQMSNEAFSRNSELWKEIESLQFQFRSHYEGFAPGIRILAPLNKDTGTVECGMPLEFTLDQVLPKSAQINWLLDDLHVGSDSYLLWTFEGPGPHELEVKATWSIASGAMESGELSDKIRFHAVMPAGGLRALMIRPLDSGLASGEKSIAGKLYAFAYEATNIPEESLFIWYLDGEKYAEGLECQVIPEPEKLTTLALLAEWSDSGHSNLVKRVWSEAFVFNTEDDRVEPQVSIITPPPLLKGEGKVRTSYTFFGKAEQIPDEAVYEWSLDGKTLGKGKSAPIVFPTDGKYTVGLTATWSDPVKSGQTVVVAQQIIDIGAVLAPGSADEPGPEDPTEDPASDPKGGTPEEPEEEAITKEERNQQIIDCEQWTAAKSGGHGETVDTWDIAGLPDGTLFDLDYNAHSVPDKFVVEYPVGTVVLDTGWRGDPSYADEEPGRYPGGVSGSGAGSARAVLGKAGHDSIRVTVYGPDNGTAWDYRFLPRCNPSEEEEDISATVSGLPPSVAYGSKVSVGVVFKGVKDASGYSAIWQSSPTFAFNPTETTLKNKSSFTVERADDNKIEVWAQVLNEKGKMVSETDHAIAVVQLPALSIKLNPDQPYIDEAVSATITSSLKLNEELLEYRWIEPSTKHLLLHDAQGSTATIDKLDPKGMKVHIEARTPYYGDSLGTLNASIPKPKLYQLEVRKLQHGVQPRTWKTGVGLVDLPAGASGTHQRIAVKVDFKGDRPKSQVLWQWKANEGTFVSNPSSQTPMVSRTEPGNVELTVVAKTAEKVVLGSTTFQFVVVKVEEAPTQSGINPTPSSQSEETKKEVDRKAALAKIADAKAKERKGDYDGAIADAKDADQLDPQNPEGKRLANRYSQDRSRMDGIIQKVVDLMNEQRFSEADRELSVAKSISSYYPPVQELQSELSSRWIDFRHVTDKHMNKIRDANDRKQYARALELAADFRASIRVDESVVNDLNQIEAWARKSLEAKSLKIQDFEKAESLLNDKDYASSIKAFELALRNTGQHFNGTEPELKRANQKYLEAQSKQKRLRELYGLVQPYAEGSLTANSDQLDRAIASSEEALLLQPWNKEMQKWKSILELKLTELNSSPAHGTSTASGASSSPTQGSGEDSGSTNASAPPQSTAHWTGEWKIVANGHNGVLDLQPNQGRWWLSDPNSSDALVEVSYVGQTLSFKRLLPQYKVDQSFTGLVTIEPDGTVVAKGDFTQTNSNQVYSWQATRSEKSPSGSAPLPSSKPSSTPPEASPSTPGKSGGEAAHTAKPAHAESLIDGATVSIRRDSFAPSEKIDIAFTAPEGLPKNAWMGIIPASVEHGSESLNNQADIAYQYLSGQTTGTLKFGPFAPGEWTARINSDGREFAWAAFTVAPDVVPPGQLSPSLAVPRARFCPSETIPITFTAPVVYPKNAWMGIIPASVEHGRESLNNQADIAYQYLSGQTTGTLKFGPFAPGEWTARINTFGIETASVAFTVAPDVVPPGQLSPSLAVPRACFCPWETIPISFTAPAAYPDNAWVGIIPASVEHGRESLNNQADIAYQYLSGQTTGTLKFGPFAPGEWTARINTFGIETASVAFTVAPDVVPPGQNTPSLNLAKTVFSVGDRIEVSFTAPTDYPDNSWVGLIPADVDHGSVARNNQADIAYQYISDRASGIMTFTASRSGRWSFRLNTGDGLAETASVEFEVK